MSIEEAAANIGRTVVYRGHSFGNQSGQRGIITSTNATYVFVRYGIDETAKATRPQDIDWVGEYEPGATEPIAGRNIGCCSLAAATWGRQHFPVCVNGGGPR